MKRQSTSQKTTDRRSIAAHETVDRKSERDRLLQVEAQTRQREQELVAEEEKKRQFELRKIAAEREQREYEEARLARERNQAKELEELRYAHEMKKIHAEFRISEEAKKTPSRNADSGNSGTGFIKAPKMPYFDEDKDFVDSYLNLFEQFAVSQR